MKLFPLMPTKRYFPYHRFYASYKQRVAHDSDDTPLKFRKMPPVPTSRFHSEQQTSSADLVVPSLTHDDRTLQADASIYTQ